MPGYKIPKDLGPVRVVLTRANTYAVWDGRRGRRSFLIPCRDRTQAEELCERLNAKARPVEIWT